MLSIYPIDAGLVAKRGFTPGLPLNRGGVEDGGVKAHSRFEKSASETSPLHG
jgi:hypothetical protein